MLESMHDVLSKLEVVLQEDDMFDTEQVAAIMHMLASVYKVGFVVGVGNSEVVASQAVNDLKREVCKLSGAFDGANIEDNPVAEGIFIAYEQAGVCITDALAELQKGQVQ